MWTILALPFPSSCYPAVPSSSRNLLSFFQSQCRPFKSSSWTHALHLPCWLLYCDLPSLLQLSHSSGIVLLSYKSVQSTLSDMNPPKPPSITLQFDLPFLYFTHMSSPSSPCTYMFPKPLHSGLCPDRSMETMFSKVMSYVLLLYYICTKLQITPETYWCKTTIFYYARAFWEPGSAVSHIVELVTVPWCLLAGDLYMVSLGGLTSSQHGGLGVVWCLTCHALVF